MIPAGRFLSGSLRLKSNVDLHLEQGAVLISSLDKEDMIDFAKDFEDDNQDVVPCDCCAWGRAERMSGSGRVNNENCAGSLRSGRRNEKRSRR